MTLLTETQKRVVSPFIKDQLPRYIRESDSLLVEFLTAFYKWLEEDGNTLDRIANLLEFKNIDKTIDEYFGYLRETYMVRIPKNMVADKKLLMKNIKSFYLSRGSQESYKFFLRALSGRDAQIIFPKEDILRVSGGFWYVEKSIYVSGNDPNIDDIFSKQIRGRVSKATAVVNRISVYNVGSQKIATLNIENQIGDFLVDEIIDTVGSAISIRAQIISVVNGVTIKEKGKGYVKGTNIPLFENPGIDFVAQIKEVDDEGGILAIEILNRGINYHTAPVGDFISINTSPAVTKETIAKIEFGVGALFTPGGVYFDDRSLISSNAVIQDNKKYQEYSYTIKSTLAIADYKEYVLNLLHPAGMYISAEVVLDLLDGNNDQPYVTGVRSTSEYLRLIIEPYTIDQFAKMGDHLFDELFELPEQVINQRMKPVAEPQIHIVSGTKERYVDFIEIRQIGEYYDYPVTLFDPLTIQQYVNKYGRTSSNFDFMFGANFVVANSYINSSQFGLADIMLVSTASGDSTRFTADTTQKKADNTAG